MKRILVALTLSVVLILAIAALVFLAPAPLPRTGTANSSAPPAEKLPTKLTINVPQTISTGTPATLSGVLTTSDGRGIPAAIITGQASPNKTTWYTVGTVTTDSTGAFSYTGTVPALSGTIYAKVLYAGNDMYAPCNSTFTL